jgi:3-oxoacyl-[acyl-carrier protein] reductase
MAAIAPAGPPDPGLPPANAAGRFALDEGAVDAPAEAVAARSGGIAIAVKALGMMHVQRIAGRALWRTTTIRSPIISRTQFVTAQAAARHMVPRGSGMIVSISTSGARMVRPGILGFGLACAAIEALSRLLAAELGPAGVRVVWLRPDATPEAAADGSHSRDVFAPVAARAGITVEEMLAQGPGATLLGRFPALAEVARHGGVFGVRPRRRADRCGGESHVRLDVD